MWIIGGSLVTVGLKPLIRKEMGLKSFRRSFSGSHGAFDYWLGQLALIEQKADRNRHALPKPPSTNGQVTALSRLECGFDFRWRHQIL